MNKPVAIVALVGLTGLVGPVNANAGTLRPSVEATAQRARVTVPGVAATAFTATAKANTIEIPIESGPSSRIKVRITDAAVKYVRIYGAPRARVSIQLRHRNSDVARIAGAVKVSADSAGLHIEIPRLDYLASVSAAAAAAARKVEPPPATTNVSPSGPSLEASPAPTNPAKTTADELPMRRASEAPAGPLSATTTADSSGSYSTLFALFVLLAGLGAAVSFVMKRRRVRESISGDGLNVLASKNLSPRSKVVLLATNNGQVLVAVTDKGLSLLAQWPAAGAPRDDSAIMLPTATARVHRELATPEPAPPASARATAPTSSPRPQSLPGVRVPSSVAVDDGESSAANSSIQGLLNLRSRMPQLSEEIATGDEFADAEWSRELLRATRGDAA